MRPSISLALIAKNEAANVKKLFDSVEGCFDEIVFVDTGSTDGTQDIAKSLGASLYHFDWVNDFSAARNFSLDQVKTDYAAWIDLDDVLVNKEAFIDFRDNAMKYFDYIMATYNYALDKNGKPVVSFMRERIFNMKKNPRWNYFVHEGVRPPEGSRIHYCTNWAINHMRTEDDMAKDKARNLNIFEEKRKLGQLDGRLTFYYGKELFENQKHEEAGKVLLDAFNMPLEPHDRILCLLYACYSHAQSADKLTGEEKQKRLQFIIQLAHQGELLAPNRAEFYTISGDSYFQLGKLYEALPKYSAAKYCLGVPLAGDKFSGPIHAWAPLYREYPRNKMAQILFNLNERDWAKKELKESAELYKSEEATKMIEELQKIDSLDSMSGSKTKTEDIVFTCPPLTAYEFDEELYKTKGMGGSETALIEMAKWLKKLTGRPVKVFNMRSSTLVGDSGVEWISANLVKDYFSRYEPAVHIAWRHNEKLTNAPSYLWCHDLMIPGVELGLKQDFVLALSPFHRDFLASSQGVPRGKILMTRNGIEPSRFETKPDYKDPFHMVFASSPDRGLKECIQILDIVREKYPVHLSVFYGRENLRKYGLAHLANELDDMIATRPWIADYGMTEQKKMTNIMRTASVWVHPTEFIETFCITALEMLCLGIYPVTRSWGAIGNTLAKAREDGSATLFDFGPYTKEEQEIWAKEVIRVIQEKSWEKTKADPAHFAWSEVAREWVNMFKL